MDVLKPRFDAASAVHKLPDDFTDDSIPKKFQASPGYSASIAQEIALLFRALMSGCSEARAFAELLREAVAENPRPATSQ